MENTNIAVPISITEMPYEPDLANLLGKTRKSTARMATAVPINIAFLKNTAYLRRLSS